HCDARPLPAFPTRRFPICIACVRPGVGITGPGFRLASKEIASPSRPAAPRGETERRLGEAGGAGDDLAGVCERREARGPRRVAGDRKSTRLNSSHVKTSYA